MNFQFHFNPIPKQPPPPLSPPESGPSDATTPPPVAKPEPFSLSGLKLKRQCTTNPPRSFAKRLKMDDGTITPVPGFLPSTTTDKNMFSAQTTPEHIKSYNTLHGNFTVPQPFMFNSDLRANAKKLQANESCKFESFAAKMDKALVRDTSQTNLVIANPTRHVRCVSVLSGASKILPSQKTEFVLPDPPAKAQQVNQFKALPLNKRILERPDKLPQMHKRSPTVPEIFSLSAANKKEPVVPIIYPAERKKAPEGIKPFVLQTELRAKAKVIQIEDVDKETRQPEVKPIPSFYQQNWLVKNKENAGTFYNKTAPPSKDFYDNETINSTKEKRGSEHESNAFYTLLREKSAGEEAI